MIAEPPFPMTPNLAKLRDELNAVDAVLADHGARFQNERNAIEAAVREGAAPGITKRVTELRLAEIELLKDRIALARRIATEWWPAARGEYRGAIDRAERAIHETRDQVIPQLEKIGFMNPPGIPLFVQATAMRHPTVTSALAVSETLRGQRWPRGFGNEAPDPVEAIDKQIAKLEEELNRKMATLVG